MDSYRTVFQAPVLGLGASPFAKINAENWKKLSTGAKVAIVAGGSAVVIGIAWALGSMMSGPKATANARRRKRAKRAKRRSRSMARGRFELVANKSLARGYYISVNGKLYNVKTLKSRQALRDAGRGNAPITYWDGAAWHDTGRVLHALVPRR